MITSTSELVDISLEERVLRIKFNRPDKKNALSREMYAAMADAVNESNSDSAVRVLMFQGSDDCFTSGNDVKDFMMEPETGPESSVGRFLSAVPQATKPIVAAVNGPAVGIGTTLLLHCDLAYAGESARFQMPFVNLGLIPEFGSSLILPQLMGHRRASDLLLLGQPFSAATAKEVGIVNDVLPDEKVIDTAFAKAQALAAQPPSALRETKRLLRLGDAQAIADRIQEEGSHFADLLASAEAMEAFTAFMEKRKPDFSQFD